MFRRVLLILIALTLFTAACTSQGLPSSYEDQDRRAEKQFIAACEGAIEGEEEDFCQCAFYTVAQDLSFDEFLELDEQLKDNPESLGNKYRELIEGVSLPCGFTADDINTAASAE